MFCGFCGRQLEDDAVFCPKCGRKQKGSSNSAAPSFGGIIDLQEIKNKSASAVSNLSNVAKIGFNNGSASPAKKYLYRIIVAIVLILLFGSLFVNAISPKPVRCEIVSASQPEQRGIRSPDGRGAAWLQDVTALYNGKEWKNEFRFNSEYEAFRRGDTITLYLSNGKLTNYKHSSKSDIMGCVYLALTLVSVGACVRFTMKYFKFVKLERKV